MPIVRERLVEVGRWFGHTAGVTMRDGAGWSGGSSGSCTTATPRARTSTCSRPARPRRHPEMNEYAIPLDQLDTVLDRRSSSASSWSSRAGPAATRAQDKHAHREMVRSDTAGRRTGVAPPAPPGLRGAPGRQTTFGPWPAPDHAAARATRSDERLARCSTVPPHARQPGPDVVAGVHGRRRTWRDDHRTADQVVLSNRPQAVTRFGVRPGPRSVRVADFLLWAVVGGIGLGTAKLATNRVAAVGWRIATHTEPPKGDDE